MIYLLGDNHYDRLLCITFAYYSLFIFDFLLDIWILLITRGIVTIFSNRFSGFSIYLHPLGFSLLEEIYEFCF